MSEEDESKNNEESLLNRHLLKIALGIMMVGVILIALAPYLFTQHPFIYSLVDKGPIGDAIGGTTAPIASLLGSILVFLSLYAQIQANRLVLKEFKKEQDRYKNSEKDRLSDKKTQQQNELFKTFVEMIETQNREVDNLSFEGIKGIDAIRALAIKTFNRQFSSHFALLEVIVNSTNRTVMLAQESKLRKEQKLLISDQSLLIISKLVIATYGIDKNRSHFNEALEGLKPHKTKNPLTGFLDLLIQIDVEIRELRKD